MTVKAELFCVLWEAAETLDQVVSATGMTRTACTSRANYYRTRGVRLKTFSQQLIDADKLNAVVESEKNRG